VTQLVGQLQHLARREPALFVGGAFALGLIGARFFKSSTRSSSTGSWDPSVATQSSPSRDIRGYARADGPTASAFGESSRAHDATSTSVPSDRSTARSGKRSTTDIDESGIAASREKRADVGPMG
jgi:hypothetical protein